jgi:hypothetical protein
MTLERWQRLLPAMWLGWLLCVAVLATPAPFALLERAEAGRVVARMLAVEAYVALLLGALLLGIERVLARRRVDAGQGSQFSLGMALAAGALFCTVAGYFALQPMMSAARAGQGAFSFGQLHAASASFYAVKTLLVAVLAWRAAAPGPGLSRGPSS